MTIANHRESVSLGFVELVPFEPDYCGSVRRLLKFLPQFYPEGLGWLDRRLSDVTRGAASCTLAVCRGRLAGLTIETPKGRRRRKLSTIYVDPSCRSCGVGQLLLNERARGWLDAGIDDVYVTCDRTVSTDLARLLSRYGFGLRAELADRYREGQIEQVFGLRTSDLPARRFSSAATPVWA